MPAQWALAFLLGVAMTLLAVQASRYFGGRPTEITWREPIELNRVSRTDETTEAVEPPAHLTRTRASAAVPAMVAAAGKKARQPGLVNINQASAAELQTLPGIGPKLSERILAERHKSPFKSVDDLRRVSGIGAKTLEHLRPYITVEDDAGRVVKAD